MSFNGVRFALGLFVTAGIVSVVMRSLLRPHRTDIPPEADSREGQSRVGQVNVLNPLNYDATGQRLLRIMFISQTVMMIGVLLLILFGIVRR